jgi:AraC-like DNA-binding protein
MSGAATRTAAGEGMREARDPVSDCGAERLGGVLSGIREDELVRVTLPLLALRCGCSPRHLRRLLRQRFGMGFRELMAGWRLERAGRLLRLTDEKVAVVAWASGYRHAGLFNVLFKRRFGRTPSEWREEGRRNRSAPGARGRGAG